MTSFEAYYKVFLEAGMPDEQARWRARSCPSIQVAREEATAWREGYPAARARARLVCADQACSWPHDAIERVERQITTLARQLCLPVEYRVDDPNREVRLRRLDSLVVRRLSLLEVADTLTERATGVES